MYSNVLMPDTIVDFADLSPTSIWQIHLPTTSVAINSMSGGTIVHPAQINWQ